MKAVLLALSVMLAGCATPQGETWPVNNVWIEQPKRDPLYLAPAGIGMDDPEPYYIRRDPLGGFYTPGGHYRSDGFGGITTPEGTRIVPDGFGGFYTY